MIKLEKMENYESMKSEIQNLKTLQKSIFTKASNLFNPDAKPFQPINIFHLRENPNFINVGPSQVPVNANVWQTVATKRVLPEVPIENYSEPIPLPIFNSVKDSLDEYYCENADPSAPFDFDSSREKLVFRREFGPVPNDLGIEVRLRFGLRVFLTLDGSVLVENGDIRVGVSRNAYSSALEHPNGKTLQTYDRVDIVTYDGQQKNGYVRYAKIWKDTISLTAQNYYLTYLVDTAGVRTTSDPVNREWNHDYCREVFLENFRYPSASEVVYISDHYRYKVEEDGTDIFTILNTRISQNRDGMLRVLAKDKDNRDKFSIRTSVENRSVTLKTPSIHCTASMGNSPHLFVRYNERRVHFDGSNFVARNMGQSASLDSHNNLRIQ